MMNDTIRQWLLEADVATLEGRGGSELARFVREDPEVGALARRLTAAMRQADAALTGLAESAVAELPLQPRDAAGPAPTVRPTTRTSGVGAPPGSAVARRRPLYGPRPAMAALTLVTAAVLLLVVRHTVGPDRPFAGPDAKPLTADLHVSSDRPFAVFRTDNPDIAIVWLLNEGD